VLLGPDDPLPARPRRVAIAGVTGSGKTTLAGRIAQALDVPHVEIDGLHWGPGWTPREEFLDDVRALAAWDRWVTEWQYRAARPIVLKRVDLMVWLDLPYRRTLAQLVRRTLLRRVRREQLWHGNVEPPLRTMLSDSDHILRWSWRTRRRYAGLPAQIEAARPGLPVVRLTSRPEVDRWVALLAARGDETQL